MKFRTEIEITSLGVKIGYENRVLALGSCFAAHIARKLAGAKFRVAENPSGILFNPLSIAAAIRSYADPAPVTRGELGFDGEVWHHFGFHGDFSAPTADEALQKMNAARQAGADALRTADRIVLTFGTAWVYERQSEAVANGYTEIFVDFVSKIREEFPHLAIMAGNVVTGDMTEELILAGADIVKVGIGPGSVCTTRKMTGVGYPQLSAIIECADAAHGLGGLICSDGGCTRPGDIAKAFGGGADFVMLGGMLAGHNESGGEVIEKDGKVYRSFYGMSSKSAMDKYSGGVAKYRAAEGKTVYLEDRGPVADTVQEILGGVRSACTYVGARRLKELTKRTTFVRVTQQLNEVFGKS